MTRLEMESGVVTPKADSTTVSNVPAADSTAENENVKKDLESIAKETAFYNESVAQERANKSRMGSSIPRYSFVHGLPFQFSPITDRRRQASGISDQYGRVFAKELLSNIPIAVLTPCVPKFLSSKTNPISDKSRNVISSLFGGAHDNESLFQDFANNFNTTDSALDFFAAEPATVPYYEYVNALCSASAINMGIGDMLYSPSGGSSRKKLKDLNWGKFNKDIDIYSLIGDITGPQINAVSFAFDSNGSLSENYSNSTRESSIASKLKGASSQVQEMEFLIGSTSGKNLSMFGDDYDSYLEAEVMNYKDLKNANPNSIISSLGRGIKTVVSGSSVRMPEIWGDSSKSSDGFNLTMKFISPYADAFSKWRWVLVPFWHVFALTAPRSTTPTSFSSPFIVKGYSKGYFNCEMGIIQSMSYRKYGDGDMISDDGIPTQIEVELNIHDLYGSLAMSNYKDPSNFFANTGLIELIGVMSGVNMNRLSLDESFEQLIQAQKHNILGTPGRFMERISQSVRNTYFSMRGYI